jgi:ubiquinone/menaquinone biosynthesis C-methylase UbiE
LTPDNHDSHIFDPKNIGVLESEERKTWQNPDEILAQLDLKQDYVVADLGCGSGYFSVPIARKVKKVYGIDVQQKMLDFLKKKIRKQKISNIETLLSEGNEIPLENERVDLLLTVNTLHEFHEKEEIAKEIKRVLKPSAKAVIVDFVKKETGRGPPVKIRVSKKQAIDLFENEGLKFQKSHTLPYHYLLIFQRQ